MESNDEILAEEIQERVRKLNELMTVAVMKRGLRIDINYNPYMSMGIREEIPMFSCKIYKEVL